jgi:hypothetical protein
MTLVLIDGFDAYGSNGVNISGNMQTGFYQYVSNVSASNTTPYNRGYSATYSADGEAGFTFVLNNNANTVIAGAKMMYDYLRSGRQYGYLFFFRYIYPGCYNLPVQAGIGVDNEGRIVVFQGGQISGQFGGGEPYLTGPVIGQSEINIMTPGQWHYVEAKWTATQVVVRVDNNLVCVADGTATMAGSGGANTSTVGNQVNQVCFNGGVGSAVGQGVTEYWVDDVYVCDADPGDAYSDFVTPITIYTLFPLSDASPNGMNVVGGSGGHYGAVTGVMNDTNYVWANAGGVSEWYGSSALPNDAMLIGAISMQTRAMKQQIGFGDYQQMVRFGGAAFYSGPYSITTAWFTNQTIWPFAMSGGYWTVQMGNGIQFGMQTI